MRQIDSASSLFATQLGTIGHMAKNERQALHFVRSYPVENATSSGRTPIADITCEPKIEGPDHLAIAGHGVHRREPDQMPWTPNDAERHTHKATTPTLKELWAKVANESLERTGDEGRAIREANAVVARQAQAR